MPEIGYPWSVQEVHYGVCTCALYEAVTDLQIAMCQRSQGDRWEDRQSKHGRVLS